MLGVRRVSPCVAGDNDASCRSSAQRSRVVGRLGEVSAGHAAKAGQPQGSAARSPQAAWSGVQPRPGCAPAAPSVSSSVSRWWLRHRRQPRRPTSRSPARPSHGRAGWLFRAMRRIISLHQHRSSVCPGLHEASAAVGSGLLRRAGVLDVTDTRAGLVGQLEPMVGDRIRGRPCNQDVRVSAGRVRPV
jgi:hypothetical protein